MLSDMVLDQNSDIINFNLNQSGFVNTVQTVFILAFLLPCNVLQPLLSVSNKLWIP